MKAIELFLVGSLFLNFVLPGTPRDFSTFDDDEIMEPRKRSKRAAAFDAEISSLSYNLADIGLTEPQVVRFDYKDVHYEDVHSKFTDAIIKGNFQEFIEFHKRGIMSSVLDGDMIELICKQESFESYLMLEYIFESVDFVLEKLKSEVYRWLVFCTRTSFEKFVLFWRRFDGLALGDDLAKILMEAIIKENRSVIDFVFNEVRSDPELSIRLNNITLLGLMCRPNSIKSLTFAARFGFNFKTLPHIAKKNIFKLSARWNNPTLTEALLDDPEAEGILKSLIDYLMAIIIKFDCTEIMNCYLMKFDLPDMKKFVLKAIRHRRHRLVDEFSRLGMIKMEILTESADESLQKDDIEAYNYVVSLGFDSKTCSTGPISFLGLAVKNDAFEIVKRMIEFEGLDINQVEQIEDGNSMVFANILLFCRSEKMIRYLVSKGLNINFIFTTFDNETTEVRFYTTMLHICARSGNVKEFNLLLELGASDKIEDSNGLSIQTLFPKSKNGYVLEPHNLG